MNHTGVPFKNQSQIHTVAVSLFVTLIPYVLEKNIRGIFLPEKKKLRKVYGLR